MKVGGFEFADEKQAEQARKELEGIRYIKEQMDMENPDMVLQVYGKVIEEKLFQTPVGYCFLKELQEYLMAVPYVRNEDIIPIPLPDQYGSQAKAADGKHSRQETQTPEKKEPEKQVERIEKHLDYKKRFYTLSVACCIMLLTMLAMFAITLTSNNPNILNYENKLINKYENWQQELEERQQQLDEREQELNGTNP